MKANRKAFIFVTILLAFALTAIFVIFKQNTKYALIIYRGSVGNGSVVKKVTWDDEKTLKTVMNLLNNFESVDFDTAQDAAYTLSIKKNKSGLLGWVCPEYYDLSIYLGANNSIVIYCAEIEPGVNLGTCKSIGFTFSDFVALTL